RIDRLPVHEHIQLDQVAQPVADVGVVEAGVPARSALEQVVEVDDQLGERHLDVHVDAGRVQVFHALEVATPAGRELHDRPDMLGWGQYLCRHPRFYNMVE